MKNRIHGVLVLAMVLTACTAQDARNDAPAAYGAQAQSASADKGQDVLVAKFKPVPLKNAKVCPKEQEQCQIPVVTKSKPGGCGATIDDDPMFVARPGTLVQWIITDHRYKFAATKGIDLEPKAPYTPPQRVSDWEYQARGRGTPAQDVSHYAINVVNASTNQPCVGDPVIVSDW
jgi:hypothetical protein